MNRVLFPRSCQLKESLISLSKEPIVWNNTKLNAQQKSAVNGILSSNCRPTPFIIFGPPGTGKTVTVVEAILQVLTRIPNSRIIACTALNSSADLIVELLLKSELIPEKDLIRISAQHRLFPQMNNI